MAWQKILMVAGEASGDLHGAHLMEAVHQINPHVHFFGMGGDALSRAGMRLLYHHRSLSVVGLTEVFWKLGSILAALRGLKRSLHQERPDLAILIDFPDFNLRLAKRCFQLGIPVLYYISPQVWAWRSGRVRSISRWVRKMVVFFSFEVPIYESANMDVAWVGHPLIDIVKPTLSKGEALQKFGLIPDRPTIALLPGSRENEIKRLLPIFLTSAKMLQKEISTLQFVVPLAPGIQETLLSPWVNGLPFPLKIVRGFTYDVMNAADLLVTASGTATLEGALLRRPMVIVYKVSWLSYLIGRILVQVDHIGMVNLVAGKAIVPELLQRDAIPPRIAEESLRILKDPSRQREMTTSMEEIRHRLGEPGATERAAHIVCSMLDEAREDP
jgi:lipid-A-disaccharide synthase